MMNRNRLIAEVNRSKPTKSVGEFYLFENHTIGKGSFGQVCIARQMKDINAAGSAGPLLACKVITI